MSERNICMRPVIFQCAEVLWWQSGVESSGLFAKKKHANTYRAVLGDIRIPAKQVVICDGCPCFRLRSFHAAFTTIFIYS
jgi:hypothetical protein